MTDRGVLAQHRFDLAEFHAEAAHLHLIVDAAEKFDRAIRQPARAVAGLVEPRIFVGGKRIAHKTRSRLLWKFHVAARDSRAADVDFTGLSGRHGFAGAV